MSASRGALLQTGAEVVVRGTSLVVFPLLAAQAGASGFGAWAQINTLVALAVPFASLGVSSALVRYFVAPGWTPAVVARLRRLLVAVVLATSAVAAVLLLASSALASQLLDWPDAVALFRWAPALVLVGVVEQFLQRAAWARSAHGWFAAMQVVPSIATVGGLAIGFLGDGTLLRGVGVVIALRVVFLLLAVPVVLRPTGGAPGDVPDVVDITFTRLVRFGIPLTISGFGLWLLNSGDRFVIGAQLPSSDLGRYSAAYTVAVLVSAVASPVLAPAYPRLMAARAGGQAAMVAELQTFHRYLALLVPPAAGLVVVLAGPALVRLGGEEFAVGRVIVLLLVLGLALDQWNGLAHYVLHCHDRAVLTQNAWLVCGAANLAGNLVAVRAFGLMGAAWATLLSFVLLEAIVWVAASRHVPLASAYRIGTTARAVLAAGVASVPGLLVVGRSESIGAMALAATLFVVTYGALMWLARDLDRSDWDRLRLGLGRPAPLGATP